MRISVFLSLTEDEVRGQPSMINHGGCNEAAIKSSEFFLKGA
jgi:hypothetical protein